MPRFAYVNGRYLRHADASVHIEDRGYQFADGIYEVIHVRAGRLIDAEPHFDRFDRSLRELAHPPAHVAGGPRAGAAGAAGAERHRERAALFPGDARRGAARP